MSTTPQYERLIAEMPAGIEADVMTVLTEAYRNHPGENVKREALIYAVFDWEVEPSKLGSSKEDRQIRAAIENLQLAGYPIISSSGKPGYRLAVSEQDADDYIAELESRRSHLASKIFALRTNRVRIHVTGYAVIGTAVFEMYENDSVKKVATFYSGDGTPAELTAAAGRANVLAETLNQRMAFA